MGIQDFIFSEKRSERIKQHLLFWGIWYPYITLTHAANPMGYPEMSFYRNPLYTFSESFFVVFAQVPTVYLMLYFVFPKFILKKRYLTGLVWIVVLWFSCGALNLVLLSKVMQPFLAMILPPENLPTAPRDPGMSFFMAVMATNKGAMTITASALMLKFGKHWYHHQHRSLQLQKQATEAQLQLLTAQVHPHFLFNTLNNVYSKTQKESPEGSQMIMGLSDLLRYVLYEGRKPLVPLDKELQMILEYINLEKIRYGNKLDLHYLVTDNTKDVYIAPLLLLPFIENCFKHGTSNVLQNPWINLTIELKGTTLVMKLMNGKSKTAEASQGKSGIGIVNVRQRLDLLYKNGHELQIREEEEVFVVDLQIELVRIEQPKPAAPSPTTETAYA
ncbi:MAG TPA: histidine kinase [Flavisolibacter sp.]|jgi:sensor histidine kinase YesM|nr:histidine kinase [Flavisolibacter sp.]